MTQRRRRTHFLFLFSCCKTGYICNSSPLITLEKHTHADISAFTQCTDAFLSLLTTMQPMNTHVHIHTHTHYHNDTHILLNIFLRRDAHTREPTYLLLSVHLLAQQHHPVSAQSDAYSVFLYHFSHLSTHTQQLILCLTVSVKRYASYGSNKTILFAHIYKLFTHLQQIQISYTLSHTNRTQHTNN